MTNTLAQHARLFSSLDSLEGVPDWFEPRVRPEERSAAQRVAHEWLAWAGTMLPGLALAACLAALGYLISDVLGTVLRYDHGKSPISPIMLAVLLGLVLRNAVGVPAAYEPGLRLCLKTVLRVGIVILGLTLSIQAVGSNAIIGLPVIVACIATALLAVTFINRALGLSRRLGTLIAVGTSICGVSAIVATAPVIDAEEDEMSYAVACITIFGLLALFTYPLIAPLLFNSNEQVGLFLGTAIHDTSQVAGAGLAYATQHNAKGAMDAAVTVKLLRNLFMSVLIPLMAVLYSRGEARDGRRRPKQKWHQVVPLFVIGFVAMACLRSLGDAGGVKAFGVIDRGAWANLLEHARLAVPWLLATAMAAVGLGTGLAQLKGLGWKPFSVGFAAAVLVGVVSAGLIKLLATVVPAL